MQAEPPFINFIQALIQPFCRRKLIFTPYIPALCSFSLFQLINEAFCEFRDTWLSS